MFKSKEAKPDIDRIKNKYGQVSVDISKENLSDLYAEVRICKLKLEEQKSFLKKITIAISIIISIILVLIVACMVMCINSQGSDHDYYNY